MAVKSSVHIDRALTNLSIAFKNEDLIADKAFPVVNVKKDSDKFFRFSLDNLRLEDDEWAAKTEAKEVEYDVTEDSYVTERRALATLIEDDERQNADPPIRVEQDAIENITEKLLIRREVRLQTILSDLANYNVDSQPDIAAQKWDDFSNPDSDPNKDVATGRKQIQKLTFKRPNLMILPYAVYEVVREHPKVTDRFKHTTADIVTADMLASLWDIERVLIAGGGQNTAAEGAADNLAAIWGEDVFIGWVTKRPALKMPSWGYNFQSQKMRDMRWRDDPREGDMVRNSFKEIQKVVTGDAGYIIQNAVTA